MIPQHKRFFILLVGSFFAQIVQVGVFPLFLAQSLSKLGISLTSIGWLVGSQWLAVLILAPLVPRLSNRFSLEAINRFSGLITLIGLLFLLTNQLVLVMLSAPLVGIGLIQRWIACDVLVVRLSPPERLGRMIGIHEALMGFAIAVGPLLFAWFTLPQVLIINLFVIALSTLLFFFIKETTHTEEAEEKPLARADYFLIKIALIAALTGGFIETAAVAFFPFYFEETGFPLMESAFFVASFGLGGTLLQLPLGWFADKVGFRAAQLVVSLIALAALGAITLQGMSFDLLLIVLFVLGGAVGAFNTLAVLQAGAQISHNRSAGAMAAIAFAYTLGGIVGPVVSAWTLESFSQNIVIGSYAAAISVLICVVIFNRTRRASDA